MFERSRKDLFAASGALPVLAIFAFSCAYFALLTPRGLPNGDAALYAQQVLSLDFASRPVHLGYYLLAALLSFFQDVPDRFFNLLSSFFAAGTLALVYLLARHLLRRDDPESNLRLAVAAPAALFANAVFLENAVLAEVYGVATFFLVLALWAWLRGQALLAGLCFGFAGLVTPSAALFAPAFLLVEKPRLRPLAILAAVAAALVLLPILPVVGEYLHGDRGLLAAAGRAMGPAQRLVKEGFELGLGFLALLPLLALGAWRAARRPRLRPFLIAWTAVAAFTLLLGERFSDVPAQLPAWALAALFVSFGAAELADRLAAGDLRVWWLASAGGALPVAGLLLARGRAASLAPVEIFWFLMASLALTFLLAAAGWWQGRRGDLRGSVVVLVLVGVMINSQLATQIVLAKKQRIESYRRAAARLKDDAAPGYLAVGSWERGILLEHYLYRRSYTEHVINTAWLEGRWGDERRDKARQDLSAALAAGREIWLLGPAPEVETQLAAAGYHIHPSSWPGWDVRRAEKGLLGEPECGQCP
jgi:hypothetical protein